MPSQSAYIVSARRSAIGRIGGLHRARRIDELCAPIIGAALQDIGLDPAQVDELIVGNASEGGNPARLIALAAGLPETSPAATIDRQCASGLDAILAAVRAVTLGEAQAIVAGGAEAISMAPWRVAKPRSLQQLPRFMSFDPGSGEEREGPAHLESSEALASRLGISRAEQDAYALKSHLKAEQAREAKRFVGEISPLRANAEEARDQSSVAPDFKDLAQLAPYAAPDGTLTPGNTSHMHDGAAVAVVVSQSVWTSLGKPRGLKLLAHATRGSTPDDEASAPIEAMRNLKARFGGYKPSDIGVVEMSESSAAQAIALIRSLDLDEEIVNPQGGAIARGHPIAAASSVLVTRLFTRLARGESSGRSLGIATLGVAGGMGVAALFEAV
jgi:acetyl-CoA C-acetyltransferase